MTNERYIVGQKKINAVYGAYELIGLKFDAQQIRIVMSILCRNVPDIKEQALMFWKNSLTTRIYVFMHFANDY